ncbi:hypothetical protein C440_14014 [Haloferax mucosum ATCC BAA-1512]|uniref:Uncharacterized protein n=1 Tax=Haloferax mucosum ATCC BAA-1512 TaxID=662479 RepID=M0I3R2_9EURY|nr:hypothetical protein [Haloferax mucosum]ELZ91435.1 hypothetical protein C440_14014 [Haloferax mucosum ATCC BAA-1512]
MNRSPVPRFAALGVELVAAAAVVTAALPLYTVTVLYWLDLTASLLRRTCQTLFAAPRETVSPTGADLAPESGNSTLSPYEQGLFRFLSPKVGTVSVSGRLPPVALHNVRPFVTLVCLWVAFCLPVAALGVSSTVFPTPVYDEFWSSPTPVLLAGGALAVAGKHWALVRHHARTAWPTAGNVAPQWRLGVWTAYWLPLWFLTSLHATGPEVGTLLSVVTALVVVGRAVREVRPLVGSAERDAPAPPAETARSRIAAQTPPPVGNHHASVRPNRRAVRLAGAIDSLFPFGNAASSVRRIEGQYAVALVLLVGVPLVTREVWEVTSLLLLGGVTAAVLGAFVGLVALVGAVHFELAFGAVEYQLADDALVAYDRRLDAAQWRVPLDAIRDATVERGLFDSPTTTDAAIVALDRTDDPAEAEPYRFYRRTLAYVNEPNTVAERLTAARTDPDRERR